MAVKLVVDQDSCIGCGLCVGNYADVFEFNDEGKAVVVADADESIVDEAIANCPVGAINQ